MTSPTTVGVGTVPNQNPPQRHLFHHNRGSGPWGHRRQRGWGELRRLPPAGADKSTCQGAFVFASGDGFSADRTAVTDISGTVEDIVWGPFVNGHAVKRINRLEPLTINTLRPPPLVVPAPA